MDWEKVYTFGLTCTAVYIVGFKDNLVDCSHATPKQLR
jgi:hypothetical protein